MISCKRLARFQVSLSFRPGSRLLHCMYPRTMMLPPLSHLRYLLVFSFHSLHTYPLLQTKDIRTHNSQSHFPSFVT
ncbi:hypothetical protein SCHPADRAFT_570408 [Schizopora paradoxa]|uniref:Uncharacterized protein n=1 Tax=Schizopora paradoxa TaxID=27342 RepID=A0A0H2RIR1_9AGAM|nr:hypothetical protein SCHPADRAFT_570408 [Schizopora paradoxa]